MTADPNDERDPAIGNRRARAVGRVVTTAVVVGLIAFWVYAFSGLARQDHPDSLDDDSFARAAEPLCAEAMAAVAALPVGVETATAQDRASVLDEATGILDDMVLDLRAQAPAPATRDRRLVSSWLEDWETYLSDRREFADSIREDPDARFLVTARAGRQVTAPIEVFAAVNDMPSCAAPGDA